jgi:hypothetical protein
MPLGKKRDDSIRRMAMLPIKSVIPEAPMRLKPVFDAKPCWRSEIGQSPVTPIPLKPMASISRNIPKGCGRGKPKLV